MTEQPTAIEQAALDAALADFDREAEIVLARWRAWLAAHPIAKDEMPATQPAGESAEGRIAGPA